MNSIYIRYLQNLFDINNKQKLNNIEIIKINYYDILLIYINNILNINFYTR